MIKTNSHQETVKTKTDSIAIFKEETPETETDLFHILLPTTYRIWEKDDLTKQLNSDWFELCEEDGDYFIKKAKYTISKGYDDCAGTETKSIDTDRKTLLLLEYKKLAVGKVEHLNILKQFIWPDEESELVFNNQKYYLRAEGKIKSSEDRTNETGENEVWHDVEDYKLFIKTETSKEELLLFQESFHDTFVKVIFIGDLDKDEKLDFIFEANRDYEERRVILFLSSEAKENKLLQKVSEISIQFDC
ncbi:hypothetical protein [Flavobacterium sp.]|uniref:hypothetical protein n=1 Tax=Flavobacterium sp. TaxID=239 RepID=UPI002B7AA4D2|nr:hypothetical protein [Flavobacterium sp.]HSD09125.1 hypothetical protein [Flavobacterium sp.]